MEFPTYREITKVPFPIKSDKPELSSRANLILALSNDKSIYVYCYGHTLVCRRTKDLKILWTRRIEPPIGAKMIMSPNEDYVAVAIADSAFRDKQKESYIYNGKTGAHITQLKFVALKDLTFPQMAACLLSLNKNLLRITNIGCQQLISTMCPREKR